MTPDRFHHHPPIRFELTAEQCDAIQTTAPKGAAVVIVGYAERHRWPHHERRCLVAWFCDDEPSEQALRREFEEAGETVEVRTLATNYPEPEATKEDDDSRNPNGGEAEKPI